MHFLITGGQGYIGNYLTASLLDDCNTITTLDSNFSSKEYDFSNYPRQKLIRHQASTCNPDATMRALAGVEVIYHLAARSDFENSYRHPMRLYQSNVEGTTNLCCMANRAGVNKIIFTSSAEVYGNLVGAKETDPTNPVNMYGASKLAAESVLRGFYQKGMEVIILRLFQVYGRQNSGSIINKLVEGQKEIYADGSQTRDFVHVDDVVQALKLARDWDPGIYNIGTGEESTIGSVWSLINPEEEPTYIPYPVGYDEAYRSCADTSLVSKYWKPKVLLSELSREKIVKLCQ